MQGIHVRWMVWSTEGTNDGPHVERIEQTTSHPVQLEDIREKTRKNNCIGMVAESGEYRPGYLVYEIYKHKLVISHFAVHREWRRRGVGTAMIDKLKSKLSYHRRNKLLIVERETNMDGLMFLRAMGFEAVGLDRESFVDTGEDAIHMRYVLPVEVAAELHTI